MKSYKLPKLHYQNRPLWGAALTAAIITALALNEYVRGICIVIFIMTSFMMGAYAFPLFNIIYHISVFSMPLALAIGYFYAPRRGLIQLIILNFFWPICCLAMLFAGRELVAHGYEINF